VRGNSVRLTRQAVPFGLIRSALVVSQGLDPWCYFSFRTGLFLRDVRVRVGGSAFRVKGGFKSVAASMSCQRFEKSFQ
jgi:hypothetical protein